MREHRGTAAAIAYLRSAGYQVLVSRLAPGAAPVQDVDFLRPTAFILGNEVNGARLFHFYHPFTRMPCQTSHAAGRLAGNRSGVCCGLWSGMENRPVGIGFDSYGNKW